MSGTSDFPDMRTRRMALEAAFTAIDKDGDELINDEELANAGFDSNMVLGFLDSNKDGELTRDEFVDAWLAYEARLLASAEQCDTSDGKPLPDWFPDEQSRRQALEAAFDQIDEDGSASLDLMELQRAGFDARLVLERLDSNMDGSLSRDEFVEQMLSLASTTELTLSAWELDSLREAQTRNEQSSKGKRTLWGSRTLRRAVEEPKFELASLIALLVSCVCYAVGTLESLGGGWRDALTQTEDVISIFFAIEYTIRWWGRSFSKRAFVEPAFLIDLLSFAPLIYRLAFLGADVGIVEGDLAFVRLLRLLRLQRYLQDTNSFERFCAALGFPSVEVAPYQLEVARVLTSIFTLLFISTGLIYNAEHLSNPGLPDYFTALYFGLTTLTTVGFGDITPVTGEGRLVVSGSILAGVAIVPVQLSTLANALLNGRDPINKSGPAVRTDAAVSCSVCGATGHVVDAAFCYTCGSRMDSAPCEPLL